MTAPATAQTPLDHSARNKREIIEIPVDSITPFPYQARRVFDEVTLAELAASIQSHGLINPITVQRDGDSGWTLIAGERRLRAVKLLGWSCIEAIIREDDDAGRAMQASIIENLQRRDLDPIEEARGYKTLVEVSGMTQSQVAEAIGRSQPAIANTMRLLELPEPVLSLVSAGQLSASHARALVQYASYPAVCQKIAELAIEESWTSKRLEAGFAGGYYDGVSAYKVAVELLTPIEYNHRTAAEAAGLTVWDNHTPDVAQYRELVEAREAERKAQLEAQMQAARDAAKADREEPDELPLQPDASGDFAPGRDPNTRNGRRRIEKDAQKAAREGLPKLEDLPYGTYERVGDRGTYGAAWPKACGPDCECRAKAVDHNGEIVEISTRPRHISALRAKETKARQDQERKTGLSLETQVQSLIAAAAVADSRSLAVVVGFVLTSGMYRDGVEHDVAREIIGRYVSDAPRHFLVASVDDEDLECLAQLPPETLIHMMTEGMLLSDARRVAKDAGRPSQRLTWYIGDAERQDGQPHEPTDAQMEAQALAKVQHLSKEDQARLDDPSQILEIAKCVRMNRDHGDEDVLTGISHVGQAIYWRHRKEVEALMRELGTDLKAAELEAQLLEMTSDVGGLTENAETVVSESAPIEDRRAAAERLTESGFTLDGETAEAAAEALTEESEPSDEVELARQKTMSYLRKSGYSIVKDGRIPSNDELYAHAHSQAKGGATKSWDWPRYERALRSVVRREVTT